LESLLPLGWYVTPPLLWVWLQSIAATAAVSKNKKKSNAGPPSKKYLHPSSWTIHLEAL
jgi:hypothetical protein